LIFKSLTTFITSGAQGNFMVC